MNCPIEKNEGHGDMACFECGEGILNPSKVQLQGTRHGQSFTVETDGLRCDHCGFATVDSEQSAAFTRLLSDEYRKANGLLMGAEIRARRAQLNMNQQQFSDYLGTGIASVKRWEAGQIQDKAMDELIRLKTDPVAARRNLHSLERQISEPVVLFDSEEMALTLSFGRSQYIERRPTMTMQKMKVLQDENYGLGVNLAA